MNPRAQRARALVLPLIALTAAAAACGGGSSSSTDPASGGKALIGTFHLTAGKCSTETPTGSYFRMIDPHGTIKAGNFFTNPDSPCKDKSFSIQAPGKQGGLVTGTYQPNPAKPFDAHGNSLADKISKPGTFSAIAFGLETDPVDPQTHHKVAAPSVIDTNGKLSGQVEAWSASWNNQYFNQGSPKPDGSSPGLTTPLSGTYNAKTGAFVLTWASEVVGGPFNGFAGYWHLQGHFTPSS
jgi:hypothetical protein